MTRDSRVAFLRRRRKPLVFAAAALAAALYAAGAPRNPPGFYIDESSIAYNAHTISRAGRDEYGNAWPLYFRAFGDYKNPVYVYLLAGLFKLTGPGITAARLLSAALGLAAALALGVLALRLSGRGSVALLTAACALATPWLFELSRVVMEVALYPLALALLLLSLQRLSQKRGWSTADAVRLALALALLTYAYSIGRLLGPLLALGLAVFAARGGRIGVVKTWCAYLLTLVPLCVFNARHPGALTSRFRLVTYLTPRDTYAQTAADFAEHFFWNMNPWRLVVAGDPNPAQVAHVFGTGHVLASAAVLSVFGAWLVISRHRGEAFWRFVIYGLVVSFVPASLTRDYVHALRLAPVPVFLLVLAVPALARLGEKAGSQKKWARVFAALLALGAAQAALFQWQFYRSTYDPKRRHLFDADYERAVFGPALDARPGPIYLADAPWIPGYIQAYWYATLRGVSLSRLVRLAPDEPAPQGALVISTEETCPRCRVVAADPPYTLYSADAPPRPPPAPLPDEALRAGLDLIEAPRAVASGEKATVRVRVRNAGGVAWRAKERGGQAFQLSLGNHWLDPRGRVLVADDGRAPLLSDLGPGDVRAFDLVVNAPRAAGDYLLEIDMVQEGNAWFGPKGSQTLRLPVRVE
jgi:4-amino-4-deoxy-L-arabinose transferase-like glycosyltransferase